MILVAALVIVMTAGLVCEAWLHSRYVHRIPVRIHVNGSRGKSSVTRLIAAGLRAGGIRTVAKTTGTKPRFIFPDGSEVRVVRAGNPNVIEQVRIVRHAAKMRAEALVVECMAIKPELQSLLEDRIILSTHSVITNARADHLYEMGPRLVDVARNLGRTVSRAGWFFTAEREHLDVLCGIAAERGSIANATVANAVTDAMLSRFGYFEHAENVALALSVCVSLGVDPARAFDGMLASLPDPGAMRIYRVRAQRGDIIFVNAFAANDPDSYVLSWERLAGRMPRGHRLLALVVCRADRIDRSRQLGEMLATRLPVDACVVTGRETIIFSREYRTRGGAGDLTVLEAGSPASVVEAVERHAGERPLVVYGIGNIVGLGEQIVEQFSSRAAAERVAVIPPAHPAGAIERKVEYV